MATEGSALTPGEYIRHHLVHLTNKKQESIVDFSVINIDSVIFSSFLGILTCFVLWLAARKATAGVPGRFQAAVEMLVEMVDSQAKAVIHNAHSRKLVAPLALTVFVWIFLMNFMDMVPVDLIPSIWHVAGPAMGYPDYMRVVATADLSTTLGLSVSVLLMCLFYNIKIKGIGGWTHELVTAPFGTSKNPIWAVLLGLINFLMQMIEFVAKTVSHGMRLFGNMFAGELVFMLIALLGGFASLSLGGGLFFVGHVIAGTVWTLFHILVITLQAFIFMMLALIYLGQAHDAH
ncbi:MAG: F0F1 ATP synthase subunit A [Hydrogenophaga sp.]|jgi:F-type H+-transporting ATPase subunit a|uniref:F0F1 ATP synthase subunit A n=1 Tax=Hydrogenophaga sp. TaxID=1904254 RepID=UPI0025C3F981|nr:F0F1 ATP synthase subunit A [Hydrogenophaga sp.]MDP2250784.1 F0F1 ATP synthase subunit A [Hydrogenophaga sp.]MDP2988828.1 F0F1 ATP synthase subunit A [Hydrogenophaga sp.]MDP3108606.1 F0F1 ATP synthase subunit A [Hydrogenophaga sp.]MDP3348328.1 F0F1 ATP synthase subunit A [Hydrogenophaga sp.]MDP3627184.1 F0F1 ATP synthase subunit A [Hydrogenophaga sp.]